MSESRAAAALRRYAETLTHADLDDMTLAELAAIIAADDTAPARRDAAAVCAAILARYMVDMPPHRVGRVCRDGVWVVA